MGPGQLVGERSGERKIKKDFNRIPSANYDKVAPLPKVTPPLSIKLYKALAKPYDALASTFAAGEGEKLRGEAEFGHTIWRMVGIAP
jgi:hypothetical protein